MADGRRRNPDGTTSTFINGKWVVNGATGKANLNVLAKPKAPPAPSNPFFNSPNPGPEFIKSMEGITKSPEGMIGGLVEGNQFVAGQNQLLNRPDINTPTGSESWTQGPDGRWTRKLDETWSNKVIRNNQEQGDIATGNTMNTLGGYAHNNLTNPYSLGGAPKVPGEGDRIGERQRIENSLMGRFNERMNPEYDRQNATLRQQLADEGQMPGSKGYELRMKQLYDQQEGNRKDYNVSALQLGGSEMTRTADLAGADYDRYKSAYDAQRYAPINEMASLGQARSMTPRAPDQNLSPMATVDFGNVDVGGAVKTFWDDANAKAAIRKSGGGGGGGGGGSTTALDSSLLGLLGPTPNQPSGSSSTGSFVGGLGQGLGAGLTISGTNATRRNQNAFLRRAY